MALVEIKDFNEMTRNDKGPERPLNSNSTADNAFYICYIIETINNACSSDETQEAFRSWKKNFND